MKKLLSLFLSFLLCFSVIAPTSVQAAVSMNKAKATMEVDSTLQLKVGKTKGTDSTWKSSNNKIASVTKSGLVTAKSEGSATITATYNKKKYTCSVTVVDSNKAVSEKDSTKPVTVEDNSKPAAVKDSFALGETWTVDGQWKLTFDSVTTTADRNMYHKTNPAQVVIIKYTYENLGYEGKFQDLFIASGDMKVIDSQKEIAPQYPANITVYPDTTPVGAVCKGAEQAFGLNNESKTITVYIDMYDSNSKKQKAKFVLNVD